MKVLQQKRENLQFNMLKLTIIIIVVSFTLLVIYSKVMHWMVFGKFLSEKQYEDNEYYNVLDTISLTYYKKIKEIEESNIKDLKVVDINNFVKNVLGKGRKIDEKVLNKIIDIMENYFNTRVFERMHTNIVNVGKKLGNEELNESNSPLVASNWVLNSHLDCIVEASFYNFKELFSKVISEIKEDVGKDVKEVKDRKK